MLRAAGERAEADDGYRGEPLCIDLPQEGCFRRGCAQQKLKQRVQSHHETVNVRFKNFGCLEQRFRHNIRQHKNCFTAIAVTTQLAIRYGDEQLFRVREYKTQTLNDFIV